MKGKIANALQRPINQKLGHWFWQKLEHTGKDPGFKGEISPWGHAGPFQCFWHSYQSWSIGITYLVNLSWDDNENLGLRFFNPIKEWRKVRFTNRVVGPILEKLIEERKARKQNG